MMNIKDLHTHTIIAQRVAAKDTWRCLYRRFSMVLLITFSSLSLLATQGSDALLPGMLLANT